MRPFASSFWLCSSALLFSFPAQALTGNEYRALNETQRQAWVVGAVDGILTTQLALTNKQPQLAVCLADVPATQQKAIFEKALEADPERWHFPAAFALLSTLNKYCESKS